MNDLAFPWLGRPVAPAGVVSGVNYLKVYAYRIRRKLGDERGAFLQSDPSVGYRLAPPGEGG